MTIEMDKPSASGGKVWNPAGEAATATSAAPPKTNFGYDFSNIILIALGMLALSIPLVFIPVIANSTGNNSSTGISVVDELQDKCSLSSDDANQFVRGTEIAKEIKIVHLEGKPVILQPKSTKTMLTLTNHDTGKKLCSVKLPEGN